MAKKWSDLPSWVRAKIVKNKQADKQFAADYEKAWAELSSPPLAGRTITVTPAGKGRPMSEADLNKELRKSSELNWTISNFSELAKGKIISAASSLPTGENKPDRNYVRKNMMGK